MSKVLNKCPDCGSSLEYHALYQYDNVYLIKKNGQLSKRRLRKDDVGSLDCGFIACSKCHFHTNCDLEIENNRYMYIYNTGNGTYMYEDTGRSEE